jgi:hypothetical protein
MRSGRHTLLPRFLQTCLALCLIGLAAIAWKRSGGTQATSDGRATATAQPRAAAVPGPPSAFNPSDPSSGNRIGWGPHRELVAILLATSTCAGSQQPDFVSLVKRTKVVLARQAAAKRVRMVTVAAVMDDSIATGMAFINRLGGFDEVAVGGNWLNHLALSLVWRDRPGPPVIPQWIILERNVDTAERSITVSSDTIMERIVSVESMRDWLKRHESN